MKQTIVVIALFFIYFHISGLATTNILRLTKGCKTSVLSSKCVCDSCSSKIPPFFQLPIISYLLCKGKCKFCGCKIPVSGLILEVIVLIGMSLITILCMFSVYGVLLSFLFYEIVRIAVIIKHGKRADSFIKQYVIAVISMIPFLFCSIFTALLYGIA